MSSMPEIAVRPFNGSFSEFERYGRLFFEINNQYRGYDQLIELVENYDLSKYDLYEVVCDEVVSGVAAVRYEREVLYFDIFVVDPGFRGIGVGDKLFNEITCGDKYVNAVRYESMALPGDRSTKNFFEQRKGKARLLIVGGEISRTTE